MIGNINIQQRPLTNISNYRKANFFIHQDVSPYKVGFSSNIILKKAKIVANNLYNHYKYFNTRAFNKSSEKGLGPEQIVANLQVIKRKTRKEPAKKVNAQLVQRVDEKNHMLALRVDNKNIGKIYFNIDPPEQTTKHVEGWNTPIKIETPNVLTIKFIDTLQHREKYKGAFNILTQAAFEKALHEGKIPTIISSVEKMGYGKNIKSSGYFAKFLGGKGSEGTSFSKEVLIEKIKKMVEKGNYIFKDESSKKLPLLITKEQ